MLATPGAGYDFVNWTESGSQVSTNTSYTFTLTSDRNLVAEFEKELEMNQGLVSVYQQMGLR